jgi:hypothetical protein
MNCNRKSLSAIFPQEREGTAEHGKPAKELIEA